MIDLYLLATVRMKELRHEAELARRGRGPRDDDRASVSRPRIVLAQWLMAVAERLWPEAGRDVAGVTR
ncbi:hypothetical protein JIG36_34035 [Actinoplanes sp. LDG1-06]|uniref:Uncharacterized protein n=1 Tax=Paractinoplanes ovalisporus TaxID=2810368 RepID=A0ABS2AL18_9ACTN|nr:hypothetical protein [Actinoplanes ovalisporus]MBM2620533.1 hypothetical protein [Actinoplanes ovalisporus]